MKVLEKTDAHGSLAEYVDEFGEETLVVTENGQPVAALVPLADTDWETLSLSANPKFIFIIERSRERQRAEGGLSSAQVRELFQEDSRNNAS